MPKLRLIKASIQIYLSKETKQEISNPRSSWDCRVDGVGERRDF